MEAPAGRFTVLVAEDEPMLRLGVVEVLEDANYRVIEAGDGMEGSKILNSEAGIDLVVSDIKMPGMNGYELGEAALALQQPPRILLMTGYAQEPLPDRLRDAGVEVLYKPFSFDVLVKTVNRLLGQEPNP